MCWNTLVIENSNGRITEKNIDEFNVNFWEKLDDDHDTDLPVGTYVTFNFELFGMKLRGHYYADLTGGDDEYPNETEPSEIELDYINNVLVS